MLAGGIGSIGPGSSQTKGVMHRRTSPFHQQCKKLGRPCAVTDLWQNGMRGRHGAFGERFQCCRVTDRTVAATEKKNMHTEKLHAPGK